MKRVIAAVSFAVLATPVLAQPSGLAPTDPIGPAAVFGFNAAQPERTQGASSGATRSEERSQYVERQPGYFDPSN